MKIEFNSQRGEMLLFLTINLQYCFGRVGWGCPECPPPPPPTLSEETPNTNPTDIQWRNSFLDFAFDLEIQIVKRISPTASPLCSDLTFSSFSMYNREERSLRHVAMVAKFLDDNKPKNSLRTVQNFINFIQFHLMCQMFAKFPGEIPKEGI